MASLSSTALFFKKAFIWIIFGIIGLILLYILIQIGKVVLSRVAPPPPLPASVAFGIIPQLIVSEGYKPPDGTQFVVETISGDLPILETHAKVFRINEVVPTFGKLEDAIFVADKAKFVADPTEVSEGIAKFANENDKSKILTVHTFSGSFTITSNYLTNSEIIRSNIKDTKKVLRLVYDLFGKLGVPEYLLPEENIVIENYKIENGLLEPALSLSNSNLIRIIFKRNTIEDFVISNPQIDNPLVWALANEKEVVAANYSNNNISFYKFSTYPLKGTAKALEDLRIGRGIINKELKTNVFVIRDVILGYLETRQYQPYLQPVYIFVSDDGLNAYVSAVNDLWTKPSSALQ